MPDDYNNVGPGAAQAPDTSTPEVRLKIHHGDPTLMAAGGIKTAAVEAPAPPSPPQEPLPLAARPVEQPGPMFARLQENVAPFNTPESRIPATEYVQINPVPIPRLVPRPAARPIPPPAVPPVPPKPAPLPIMTGQAIGPIIRKRPSASMRVVQPASTPPVQTPALPPAPQPQAAAIAQPTSPAVPSPPPTAVAPAAPAVSAPPSPPTPPSQPVAPLRPAEPAPVAPPAPLVEMVATDPAAGNVKPLMIYSNNTRTVWSIRRSGRVLYSAAALGLVLVLIGLYVYWKSLGSPTSIRDIPLLHLH